MSSNRIWFGAVSLAVLSLGACAGDPKTPALTAKNPGELYPLHAEFKPDQVALALHADGFSTAQVQALGALAQRWRDDGGEQTIVLQAPRGASDAAQASRDLAARAQAGARVLLVEAGVPTGAIRMTTYDAADPAAPLLVAFSRYQAQVASCGKTWENLTSTAENAVQSNFGCAVSANMAAQIARPADIAHPRSEDAPDADRRQTVLGLYKAGKPTAAQDEPNKSGLVSKAVP